MSELKIGGLALVIGCMRNPRHIGKVVELIAEIPSGYAVSVDGALYYCITGEGFVCSGDNVWPQDAKNSKYGAFDKKHLLPIKPEADPLDVTETQELHA